MENKAILIKMVKSSTNKVDMAKTIVNITCCFNNLKLSETESTILSYFMVYGINPQSKQLIIKSGVCKNISNIKTIMVKLKKQGFIYKDDLNGKVYVDQSLRFNLTPSVGIYLKIDTQTA
jgi:hypothetical protein